MGIAGYKKWLLAQFPGIAKQYEAKVDRPGKVCAQDANAAGYFDHVLIDLNDILHKA